MEKLSKFGIPTLPEKTSEKIERGISVLQHYLRSSLLSIALLGGTVHANNIPLKKDNPSSVSKEKTTPP